MIQEDMEELTQHVYQEVITLVGLLYQVVVMVLEDHQQLLQQVQLIQVVVEVEDLHNQQHLVDQE
jgi:hypothetical protein